MALTLPGSIKSKISQPRSVRWLAIISGCLIIITWTLTRFFNQSPSFDLFGQQVLAHQWLHGQHTGAVIGPTNYVLKIIFLYMPVELVPVSAQLKIILMTVLVNIATYVLLIYALERIWNEFYPKLKDSFCLPFIYLALISGSVYWISFTNSRNLEVTAGVWLVYLYLKTQRQPNRRNFCLIILLGSLLFFADPLQIYMTLLPCLIFVGLRWSVGRQKDQLGVVLKILGCTAVSILIARFLTKTVEAVWNVSFINTGRVVSFSMPSLKLSIEQMARLYAGGFEGGRVREVLDLLVVACTLLGAAYFAWRQPKSRWLLALCGTIWIVDLVVYIISGQALQPDTNRYLIMTVPVFILALALVLYYLPSTKSWSYFIASILLFNIITLAVGFVKAWDPQFDNNVHDRSVISYFKIHKYSYGYASINTALSSDYLSSGRAKMLPLGCDPGSTLKKTNLFFDKSAFGISQQPQAGLIPIILDGNTITISPTTCEVDQIEQQLGPVQQIDHLSDGSTVLLYKTIPQLPTAWR